MKKNTLFKNWQNKYSWTKTEWGLTNNNFLLDNKYLLRKAPKIVNPFVQRENEIAVQSLLENQKINVPVLAYYYDKDNCFTYITEFQQNSHNFAEKPINKVTLRKVSEIIKKLHAVDHHDSKVQKLNMMDNLQKHIASTKKEYGENMAVTNQIMFDFLKMFDFSDLVVSHNDLMKENILVDENDNYYIIDYEYCGLNVRFYDYAVFIASVNLITQPKLHQYWLSLFDLTSNQNQQNMNYFTLYRSLIGYYWANNMWETYQEQKYYDLMMYKWRQSQWFFREIKGISHPTK